MTADNHNFVHYIATSVYFTVKSLTEAFLAIIVAVFGWYLFEGLKSPLNIILSFPLVFGAGGFAISKMFTAIMSIFSPRFNRGVCVFCT